MTTQPHTPLLTFTVGSFFCGLGGKTLGALAARMQEFGVKAEFRSVGGIDFDLDACRDFEYLTKSPALKADIATMTPEELRAFMGDEAPDVVIGSPPCKGFSSLLGSKKSQEPKYQKLNKLVLDWLELLLDTWSANPPGLILLENVPRIQTRGKKLLKKVRTLLAKHGYVFHEDVYDCGEFGGLAQHRQRYLMVARRPSRVGHFLYEPRRLPVRGCGEIIGPLPLPGEPKGGLLHALPKISWINWVRLALIPPGGDWQDLPKPVEPQADNSEKHAAKYRVLQFETPATTVVAETRLGSGGPSVADPRISTTRYQNNWHVESWSEGARTVTGTTDIQAGAPSVGDARISATGYPHTYGVLDWEFPSHTVKSGISPGTGPVCVADPRIPVEGTRHNNVFVVRDWGGSVGAINGGAGPSSGAESVADARLAPEERWYAGVMGVLGVGFPAPTVSGSAGATTGSYSIADPRLTCTPRATSRVLGVLSFHDPSLAVTGAAQIDNGDPRVPGNPTLAVRWYARFEAKKAPPFVPVLPTVDGTWHRPLTTLELAALQGLPTEVDGKPLTLAGKSQEGWRQRIGNAVPPPAAQAICEQMLRTLVCARLERFVLSGAGGVWVERYHEALHAVRTQRRRPTIDTVPSTKTQVRRADAETQVRVAVRQGMLQ